jgi:hypothetical protein
MKHLIGIFMSAMYYNAQMTVDYLETNGMTASIVNEMIKLRKSFKHEYERKFFIVGLSEMLMCRNLPESLQPVLVSLLNNLIDIMLAFNQKIQKDLLQKAQTELKDNENDEDEDEDSDGEDSDLDYEN